jgi:putative transposase
MHKRAVEPMLEAEPDAHLDNEKHEKSKEGNYRNGHGTKKIKSSFGESEIKVPRDRASSFEPVLVPKDITSSKAWRTLLSHPMPRGWV